MISVMNGYANIRTCNATTKPETCWCMCTLFENSNKVNAYKMLLYEYCCKCSGVTSVLQQYVHGLAEHWKMMPEEDKEV